MVRLHHVDERALRASLDGRHRHDDRALAHVEQQPHVDELIGEQRAVLVREDRLQPGRPGRLVDLVVGGEERARGDVVAVGAVVGLHRQRLPGRQLLHDGREVVLGDREHHRDRLELRDDDQAVRIARVDHVADVEQAEPDPSADGGGDASVLELEAGGVDQRLVHPDRALELADRRALVVDLLLGDELPREQLAVASEVDLRVLELRLVARELALGLRQLRREGPGVDLGEEVSLVHELALLEGHPDQLAVDAALHRDGVEGEHRAEPGQVHRHVAFSRRRRHHGHARADRLAGRLGGGRLPARPGGAQLVGGPGEEEEGHEPGPAAGPRPPHACLPLRRPRAVHPPRLRWRRAGMHLHALAAEPEPGGRCRALLVQGCATMRRPVGVPTPRMKTPTTAVTSSSRRSPSAR